MCNACVKRSLMVAGLLGALAKSWTLFLLTAAALLVAAVHAGDIRLR